MLVRKKGDKRAHHLGPQLKQMAEHSELVSEMPLLERMSTQDRLKLARKRRLQQLKKYNQKDKEVGSKKKKNSDTASSLATSAAALAVFKSTKRGKKCDYKVHFVPSVMLLESAARNDIDEVRRLLMLGVNPDSTNEDGLTALHQVSYALSVTQLALFCSLFRFFLLLSLSYVTQ